MRKLQVPGHLESFAPETQLGASANISLKTQNIIFQSWLDQLPRLLNLLGLLSKKSAGSVLPLVQILFLNLIRAFAKNKINPGDNDNLNSTHAA